MRRKIEHRILTMDGRQVAVLAVADFERLDAARRQLGASEAQAHQLRQQLRDARRRLARLEGHVGVESGTSASAGEPGRCRCVDVPQPGGPCNPSGGRRPAAAIGPPLVAPLLDGQAP
ncbi:hypothetical protein ACGF3C_31195 [Micromonospora sp. NPDC047762]|uniref:hypothetical protein n=1 Tax=Micromonospora sp. NPDC047762 TaxID=3364255 RepID=UPI0037210E04